MNDKNDAFGNHGLDARTLEYLTEQLSDFKDEYTLLQYHGRKVDRTPKCDLKMAGKGVEYDWAFGKMFIIIIYHKGGQENKSQVL